MSGSQATWRMALVLALAGGLGFWTVNFAISLTPIAAEYRAALSISYLPMLVESLLGGLIIGACVSYSLLHFFDDVPMTRPVVKSLLLSFVMLILVTVLIEYPSRFLGYSGDALRYFLIGTTFNVARILTLGVVIGYVYERLHRGFTASAIASKSAPVG